jgi:uncharacterized protein (TIGR03435 family)
LSQGGDSPCQDGRKAGFQVGPGLFASCEAATTMEQLAVILSRSMDRAVVDQTGLDGRYAFMLRWAPDRLTPGADALPSIFTAVQEQLGLKLEPRRLPLGVVVIDRAEQPSPN